MRGKSNQDCLSLDQVGCYVLVKDRRKLLLVLSRMKEGNHSGNFGESKAQLSSRSDCLGRQSFSGLRPFATRQGQNFSHYYMSMTKQNPRTERLSR